MVDAGDEAHVTVGDGMVVRMSDSINGRRATQESNSDLVVWLV